MKQKLFSKFSLITVLIIITLSCGTNEQDSKNLNWPETTYLTKPWTRWWWHGSAVTEKGITQNLEKLKKAGFGGVEITPIYGVKGFEDQDISFLSQEWMKIFEFTLQECQRLNLGVDLANASGWPFGGPWISSEDACKNVHYKTYSLSEGEQLKEKIEYTQEPLVRAVGHRVDISSVKYPISSNTNLQELALDQVRFEKNIPLQTLMGYDSNGGVLDLTKYVDEEGNLNWKPEKGDWKLYAVFQGWHGKMVERAGKGGEGNVIDHFSESAAEKFLNYFDNNAEDIEISGLRAFFNDSYEVDDASGEANWTPLLFKEFLDRRGYDLKNYLPALFGKDSEELNKRVICDYRETISDLLLERFTIVWKDWSRKYDAVIRNQAHGSPANILDLYAASDIPETEGTSPMRIKMATSAGHVSGKKIIACEASTWLDEHFLSDLSEVKQNVDRYFTHGVNHIVYHGTPYSPVDDKWPGWMFYASTHFAPTNTWWKDLSTINAYITNVQSFLQNSKPSNDILIYFPIYDKWSDKGNSMLHHFGHGREDLTKELSESLLNDGYNFDYISDKQIRYLKVNDNSIVSKGSEYKTIIIPECEFIPLETIEKVIELAKNGANVIIENDFPKSISGYYQFNEKEESYNDLKESIQFVSKGQFDYCELNSGKLYKSNDIKIALNEINIFEEGLAKEGLWFNKVERNDGLCYFITNWSEGDIDQWIKINNNDTDALLFNPMNRKFGKAKIRNKSKYRSEVYLQLAKGETIILQWYSTNQQMDEYPLFEKSNNSITLDGEWNIEFVKGGPILPSIIQTDVLKSWPEISDELKSFSGTAKYSTTFQIESENIGDYLLDLGDVFESAVVILNGEEIATLVGPVFQVHLDAAIIKEVNELEILVTNLMANRIIDMEKKGEEYRKFYNINFSAKFRENYIDGLFSAKHWDPVPSGLIGPVKIVLLEKKSF